MKFFIYFCNLAFFAGNSYGQNLVRSSVNSLSSVKTKKIRQTVGQPICSVPLSNFYYGYQSPLKHTSNTSPKFEPVIVYPNPAVNSLYVKLSSLNNSYRIINDLGQLVKKGDFKNKDNEVSIFSLPKGIYNFVILNKLENIIFSMKILKN